MTPLYPELFGPGEFWASAKAEPGQGRFQRRRDLHQVYHQNPFHVLVEPVNFRGSKETKEFTLQASLSVTLPLSRLCQVVEFMMVRNCPGAKALTL